MKKPTTPANAKQVGGTHYKEMGVQPWDVVDTWPIDMRIGAYRAGALKYLMRMGTKDESAQEIGKGIHYLEKLKEVLESPEYRAVGNVNDGAVEPVRGIQKDVARSRGTASKPGNRKASHGRTSTRKSK